MTILIALSLLLLLGVPLVICVLSVLRNLVERNVQDGPVFHDTGPVFHDPVAHYREARSQFAWQSRSHFRAPD